jgi:hypothetical protein
MMFASAMIAGRLLRKSRMKLVRQLLKQKKLLINKEVQFMDYKDKNGKTIEAGMTISICGDPDKVYKCQDQFGHDDLGVNASNEDYLELHPGTEREYYSLSNFLQSDIEIVK